MSTILTQEEILYKKSFGIYFSTLRRDEDPKGYRKWVTESRQMDHSNTYSDTKKQIRIRLEGRLKKMTKIKTLIKK